MISEYFIKHPIFSSVISIVLTLGGIVAIKNLPIEQYPNITPPLIQVSTIFNGANADVIANDVAAPLEQQILAAQDLLYMYSQSSSNGNFTLNAFFDIQSNPDIDKLNVQNLVGQAQALLPEAVIQEGISIKKLTPNILMLIALQSPEGLYDETFISNYTSINLVNELQMIEGVSSIAIIGQRDYSIRIWLRPDLMAQLGISPQEVIQAVQEQNADFGLGQLGFAPNAHPVSLTIPFASKGRLTTAEEFGDIILKSDLEGNLVLLKDVAHVNLGALDYSVSGNLNTKSAILLSIHQDYGANAINVAQSIRDSMEKMSKNFPQGLTYSIPHDSTIFIQTSIKEVIMTLLQAALLVVLVVFVFLQKIRITIIPVLALVVSIIGTFAGMYLMNYSINLLSLFGLILAVGIVVDDAIVVVENVERNMHQFNLAPKEAAIKAMSEVSGPVVAIVFVLCAVFIPVVFLGGVTGQLYKQFAVTIAVSVCISGIVALTLSPSISAIIMKNEPTTNKIAITFNQILEKGIEKYSKIVLFVLNHQIFSWIVFSSLVALGVFLGQTQPKSFLPNEDQGFIMAQAILPDGASLGRTEKVDQLIQEIALSHPGVDHVTSLNGFNCIENVYFTSNGANYIVFKDWSERSAKNLSADQILIDLNEKFAAIEDANVVCFSPPPIQGIGTVGGFQYWLENRGDGGNSATQEMIDQLIAKAKDSKVLLPLQCTSSFDNLQLYIDLDRYKAKALGVAINEVFQALQTMIGSVYINNFNKFGRVYQVIVQAEPSYRDRIENLGDMYIRSKFGQMVPLKSLINVRYSQGANLVSRFNDYPAVQILGGAKPGYTTGEAIAEMEKISQEVLSGDFSYGWSGQAYQEISTGKSANMIFLAALIMVFLILAALYERWLIPFAIIMIVPFGVLGAFVAIFLKGMANDIYFQIGLITLIALSAKNAILIVEFALLKVKEGADSKDAIIQAVKLRSRAILMTSLTFILGVFPLVIAQGAGAASRHSVGVGIFGGMIAATLFAPIFVSFFFQVFFKGKNEKV